MSIKVYIFSNFNHVRHSFDQKYHGFKKYFFMKFPEHRNCYDLHKIHNIVKSTTQIDLQNSESDFW